MVSSSDRGLEPDRYFTYNESKAAVVLDIDGEDAAVLFKRAPQVALACAPREPCDVDLRVGRVIELSSSAVPPPWR